MNITSPFRLSPGLVLVTGLFGVFVFGVFYPGAMSPDSLLQWGQSITKQYTDWHPPIYAITLRVLRKLWDSPAVMLAWNVSTFSIGSLLAAEVARQRVGRIAYLIPAYIFLPFVLNHIGVLWKDVALGVSWWAACGIALYAWHTGQQARSRKTRIGIHLLMAWAYVLFGRLRFDPRLPHGARVPTHRPRGAEFPAAPERTRAGELAFARDLHGNCRDSALRAKILETGVKLPIHRTAAGSPDRAP